MTVEAAEVIGCITLPSTLGNEVVGNADPLIIFLFLTSFLLAGFKDKTADCWRPSGDCLI